MVLPGATDTRHADNRDLADPAWAELVLYSDWESIQSQVDAGGFRARRLQTLVRMGHAARQRAFNEHSAHHRALELVALLQSVRAGSNPEPALGR